MTVSSLVTALAVGAALGLGGRWIGPARRGTPFWVPLAVAVGAAMLATVVARLAGIDTVGVTVVEVVLQVVFAAIGVAFVAATGDRRYDNAGRSR
ncbi:GlsB/YeaQ/YmgE family stress response membrane protein [Paractinoplanes atraurantiacus]|uniref:Transglycosylase associated protein n=1 Tax=Paractinoplanes atraurantiacus TaxID=1036182 RepID=A0A285GTL7_9ACTN|nr:GlsB/YeaQ/YmgE family stress response membrane protein [Actinoplanes atraurantiacus]SNY25661.1 hypothetical protein SAMN05421748_102384 [Actinoplanes atraurantiacus]